MKEINAKTPDLLRRKIGRIDKVDFPLLDLQDIEVKIDTGAFTSTIHCSEVRVEDNYLKCRFMDQNNPHYHDREIIFDEYDVKVIRSSNGQTEARYRILTHVILFDKIYPIYLTLSDREEMKYPVLLGRKFLIKKFIVDINRTNLSFKYKQKKARQLEKAKEQ